jgi:alkanesulfonate monooxygenase SsuD/methylene tetrahydromethanopterin reductase-like flavin-dependent oxidoreductase (luciferase family)
MSYDVTSRERATLHNANKFKVGLFAANLSSGRTATLIPERWSGSWPDNLRLARMADDAGLDFMLPLARWKGYGGDTDYQGTGLETFTWTSGLLASTQRMTVFATVHAPLFNPVIAAKACATADHIGNGRFGLNLVVGWNEDEFAMFGVQQREHEQRYEYGQEWLDAVKRMWSSEEDFDVDGKYIKLKGVRAKPKPVGGVRPLLMNAGASPVGRAFAVRNTDAFFIQASRVSNDETAGNVKKAKDLACEYDRDIDVYTVASITCRRSRKEAEEYYRYAVLDNADFSAIDRLLALKDITPAKVGVEEFEKQRRLYTIGYSGKPIIGDPDDIAEALAAFSGAGLTGIGLSFVNYLDELPFFNEEVLPRLERRGLRVPKRERPRMATTR